jgi:hypothetical protein
MATKTPLERADEVLARCDNFEPLTGLSWVDALRDLVTEHRALMERAEADRMRHESTARLLSIQRDRTAMAERDFSALHTTFLARVRRQP